jgi:hypothetical protein
LVPPSRPRRPRQIGRPLADLVAPALGKTLAARGFAAADVVLAWPEIVGERLAGVCEPIALEWPRGPKAEGDERTPATLVMRVEGAFGLEIQHLASVILERVNSHFGWRCAGKLAIRQGRVTGKAMPKPAPPQPDPRALAKGKEMAAGISDEKLRGALAELGALVLARQ